MAGEIHENTICSYFYTDRYCIEIHDITGSKINSYKTNLVLYKHYDLPDLIKKGKSLINNSEISDKYKMRYGID